MARPPRQLPPSAIDGYRRLSRTRGAATPPVDEPVAEVLATSTSPSRARRRARAAGALRLAGFVAVIIVIVGTSVSLASADSSDSRTTRSAPPKAVAPAEVAGPALPANAVKVAKGTKATTTAKASTPAAADVVPESVPVASTTTTTAAAPSAAPLPFTGDDDLARPMLAGALLVLLGMLVQVAGQPLPARAAARRH